jgi:hypothetical protein
LWAQIRFTVAYQVCISFRRQLQDLRTRQKM